MGWYETGEILGLSQPPSERPVTQAQLAALSGYTGGNSGTTITTDSTPTSGSTNPVQSGGVYSALANNAKKLNDVVIDVAKVYGVIADGTTDNAMALMQMRSDLAGTGKTHYILLFPSGEIRYSDNRWLYNIQSFECIGNGTTLRSIRGGAWGTEWQPLQAGDMFTNNILSSYTPGYVTGHLFNTVVEGSNTITLTTTSDYGNYAVGNRIFICGQDKTLTGYPPNPMYFEWAVIKSINSTTGVITLNKGLKYAYNSNFKDSPNGLGTANFGKPRIYNLDRTDYHFPKYAKFKGIVFANGTKGTGSVVAGTGIMQFPCEDLVLEDCTTEYAFWTAQNIKSTANFCRINGDTEFDKIVDYARFENCEFGGFFANATSCNTLELKRNNFGDYAFIAPYILYAEGNHFHSSTNYGTSLQQGFGGEYMKKAYLKDNTFSCADTNVGGGHIELGRIYTFTVAGVSGNDILVTASGNNQIAYTLRKGVEIWKSNGTKRGTVNSVNYNGTQWVIIGDWELPAAGETWAFSSVGEIIDEGGNVVLGGKSPLWNGNVARFSQNTGQAGLRTTVLTQDVLNIVDNGGQYQMQLNGTLVDISINVIKAYSGTNDNAHLLVTTNNNGTNNLDINLLAKGRRTLTAGGVTGAQSGDGTASATNMNTFVTTLNLNNLQYTTFQKIGITNPQDMPQLEIIIHWYKN